MSSTILQQAIFPLSTSRKKPCQCLIFRKRVEAELRFTSADLSRFFLLRNVSGSVFFSPASGGFHNGGEELLELTKKPVGFPGI